MAVGGSTQQVPWLTRLATSGFGVLLLSLGLMWVIEIADSVVLNSSLEGNGIQPRLIGGLDGIFWAPFLHSNMAHLISNSAPFLFLGFLVAIRGLRHLVIVTAVVMIGGGFFTWLLGASGNHIGASGVVFGYFGALIGAAVYDRKPRSLAPALVAVLLYSGLIVGVVPQQGISWEGHLFGLVFGFLAGRGIARLSPAKPRPEAQSYSWEADKPWLEP